LDHAHFLWRGGERARGGRGRGALGDADQEFGRADPRLDRAELDAFDLTRNRAELARRINLALDASAGILLDRSRESLEPLVLGIVDGGGAELHDGGLGVLRMCGQRRAKQHCDRPAAERCRAKGLDQSVSSVAHLVLRPLTTPPDAARFAGWTGFGFFCERQARRSMTCW